MPLTLRHTGLSSPVYRDQLDYTIFEDGRPIPVDSGDEYLRAVVKPQKHHAFVLCCAYSGISRLA